MSESIRFEDLVFLKQLIIFSNHKAKVAMPGKQRIGQRKAYMQMLLSEDRY